MASATGTKAAALSSYEASMKQQKHERSIAEKNSQVEQL